MKKKHKKIIFQKMLAEFFLFLATTYHFWVQIMILILVGQLQTLRVEFGLGEVWRIEFLLELIKSGLGQHLEFL